MSIRPIIFSAPMVRALLKGSKTQTRRVLKKQPAGLVCLEGCMIEVHYYNDTFYAWPSPYNAGDLLYVREAHYVWDAGNKDGTGQRIDYRATTPDAPCTWSPSILMPRWASRLTLEVTDVRVQRLQNISEDDAMSEGIYAMPNGSLTHDGVVGLDNGVDAFARLWRMISGPGSWDANPWVVAVTFTVHKINVDHFRDVTKMPVNA